MPNSDLQISIYDLNTEEFIPDTQKYQLYGDYHGAPIAFEFILKESQWENIPAALRWFARYVNYPTMELIPEDPRRSLNLRVVR
ncbi:hypothetical protein [Mucilaginibacter sp. UYCu711]|uniref:hypothetical protein n=1 Tax=Mucilaginibacter sp. UYCu711 TaxID=3156339 RepID=UPI003D204CB3